MQLARPASSPNVTLCERQNQGAPELTRARTHRRPRRLFPPGAAEKAALPPLPGTRRLSKLSAAQSQPGRRRKAVDSLLSPLPARAEAPHPPPRTPVSPTPPLWVSRGQSREPGVPPFGSHVSALWTAPGRPGPLGLAMASVQQGEKQLFEKFWRGTFKAVATPRPESIIVASITARKPLPR